MNMNDSNDTQVSTPTDSGGKISSDNRSQSRICNQQSSFMNSKTDFKKPRFSQRSSYPRIPLSFNRAKLSIPYKSELCMLFQRGKCYYGENCHYAHNMNEITKNGFKTVAMMDVNSNEDSRRNAMCIVKECHFFSSGMDCPYGDKCHFLHKCDWNVRSDVGLYRESHMINAANPLGERSGSDQIECRNSNAGEDYARVFYRKTKLCTKWERFGSCLNGERCNYAHGKAELQEPGYFAELERRPASSLMLDSQPNNGASCEIRIKTAKELRMKGKKCFMKWDIAKISQVYADWIDDRRISLFH